MPSHYKPDVWLDIKKEPIECADKVRILNDSLDKIRSMCEEMVEDAVIMGCNERHVKSVLVKTICSLEKPFSKY